MNLLVERSKDPGLPSVNTFNTFFYPKLRSSGYSAVRRWTKKTDIFSVDILLVPVHLGMHWCLSVSLDERSYIKQEVKFQCFTMQYLNVRSLLSQVVDFRKKSILYFDSMGGSNNDACRLLL